MKRIMSICAIVVFVFIAFTAAAVEEEAGKSLTPKKITVDTNYDGEVDRIEYYNSEGMIEKVEVDSNGNGIINEWVTYKDGLPVKSERDTNDDGKPDVWLEY